MRRFLLGLGAVLGADSVGRQVDHLAFDHGRQALVERGQPHQGFLPFLDVPDLARIEAGLDDQLVVDGQQLEDDRAGADDAARRVLVQLDDDAAHRRAHLRAIDHVAGGADLLLQIVQLRLGGAHVLDGLLRRGGAQLGDLLLGARDALPRVGRCAPSARRARR